MAGAEPVAKVALWGYHGVQSRLSQRFLNGWNMLDIPKTTPRFKDILQRSEFSTVVVFIVYSEEKTHREF